jgi:hypothetical protein
MFGREEGWTDRLDAQSAIKAERLKVVQARNNEIDAKPRSSQLGDEQVDVVAGRRGDDDVRILNSGVEKHGEFRRVALNSEPTELARQRGKCLRVSVHDDDLLPGAAQTRRY